ncbi:hypothetical protein DTL21_08310 [Bremerella cremea]|uniref:Uncharacterized protein n=1 Tax=Blastopirellula marina TaxID=124 RepID=A0A2S8FUS8_9BACT|nr:MULTISPECIES: hypothetical protein [Pirellulaceae]PQO35927.1 hypothetical protein C5Y83_08305 [Blastopirellula marina]RCS48604.1 hypothetical protein DTL21_08310 [Bremerella cremea]
MASDLTGDPVRLAIAICPLAAYLLLIGFINLRRSPFITSGGRDALALSIGLSGLALIGPLALMMPSWSIRAYGGYAWVIMLTLYFLLVTFVILISRPRIIAYNTTIKNMRPLLREVADSLDPAARWAGESLFLPTMQLHLIMEEDYGTRNVQIKSVGSRQDFNGWRQLELALVKELRQHEKQSTNLYGIFLLAVGLFLLAAVCVQVYMHGNFVDTFLHDFYFDLDI